MSESADASSEGVTIRLHFFANLRDVVGRPVVERTYPGSSVAIGTVIEDLEAEYPDLGLTDADGGLREHVGVLKDGRHVIHLDGLETKVDGENRITFFPAVPGG